MTTLNHLFDLPGQICHVQCGYCSTILLVSVPFSSLSMLVTVRCGHCTSLLSVNMMKASFIPFHLLASLTHLDQEKEETVKATTEQESWKENQVKGSPPDQATSSDNEDEDVPWVNQVVNKPPERRQRAPSAYNCFIKEEISRLKAQNPSISHKEAFSLAAKNWAHFPRVHHKRVADHRFSHGDETAPCNSHHYSAHQQQGHEEGDNGYREKKAPRHTLWGKSPFE